MKKSSVNGVSRHRDRLSKALLLPSSRCIQSGTWMSRIKVHRFNFIYARPSLLWLHTAPPVSALQRRKMSTRSVTISCYIFFHPPTPLSTFRRTLFFRMIYIFRSLLRNWRFFRAKDAYKYIGWGEQARWWIVSEITFCLSRQKLFAIVCVYFECNNWGMGPMEKPTCMCGQIYIALHDVTIESRTRNILLSNFKTLLLAHFVWQEYFIFIFVQNWRTNLHATESFTVELLIKTRNCCSRRQKQKKVETWISNK